MKIKKVKCGNETILRKTPRSKTTLTYRDHDKPDDYHDKESRLDEKKEATKQPETTQLTSLVEPLIFAKAQLFQRLSIILLMKITSTFASSGCRVTEDGGR